MPDDLLDVRTGEGQAARGRDGLGRRVSGARAATLGATDGAASHDADRSGPTSRVTRRVGEGWDRQPDRDHARHEHSDDELSDHWSHANRRDRHNRGIRHRRPPGLEAVGGDPGPAWNRARWALNQGRRPGR